MVMLNIEGMTWDVMRTPFAECHHHQQEIRPFFLGSRIAIIYRGLTLRCGPYWGPRVQIKILCPSNEMILSTVAGRVFASLGVTYILDFPNLQLKTKTATRCK